MTISIPRILMSAAMIVFVGALVIGGTGAFFSDEETSTGNVFTAGALDLKIDSVQHYNGMVCAEIGEDSGTYAWVPDENATLDDEMHAVADDDMDEADEWDAYNDANPAQFPQAGVECTGSWRLADDNGEGQPIIGQFWDFDDIKPGDQGENTISIHIDNNDAWMCASLENVSEADNGQTEPEDLVDPDGDAAGELDDNLYFFGWLDDGDNIYEPGELIGQSDVAEYSFGDPVLASDLADGTWTLADSNTGVPIAGDETHYIGVYWCAGTIDTNGGAGPLTCDGESMGNEAQTDSWMTDLKFYIEQSRNNPDFECNPEEEPEEREPVGAVLGQYTAPTAPDCDFTVEDDESIQEAVNGAATDDTICVDPSYTGVGDTFPVTLDATNLTVAGLGAAGDAEIPGGFFIDASGVTVTGLEFTDYSFIASSENAAVYIHNEAGQGSGTPLQNTTISYNVFTAPGGAFGANAKGVVTEIANGATPVADGITVMNNSFTGWNQAMFFNTASDYVVSYNDISANNVGVANDGPNNGSIHHNDFVGNVAEAVGVAPSAVNGTANDGVVTVNTNNFGPAGAGNNVNFYLGSVFGGADVDATGNWWDGEAEADRTNDTAEVDTSSPAALPFPS